MFNLAIDSKLGGCDLTALRWSDIAQEGRIRRRAVVLQRKTGRPVQFEITDQSRDALAAWRQIRRAGSNEYVFPGRERDRPMSTRQYSRLVKKWVASAGLDASSFGTHSLRRTKPALIYRKTGNLRAVQPLLGHTKLDSTVRYLGIEVDDALAIAEQLDL
jgi:integrase